MKVAILDDVTRRNILLFKSLVQRMQKTQLKALTQKAMRVYVNKANGSLQFDDLQGKPEAGQWKIILIKWDSSSQNPLEVIECNEEGCFTYNDLNPEAMRRLADTIKTLNRLAFDPTHRLTSETAISSLEVEDQDIGQQLIKSNWHDVDREGAEKLLEGKMVGTYLFRKGEFAEILEKNLSDILPEPVFCFTITFNEWDDKISERIIVFKSHEWLFYDDDPNMKTVCYLTLGALIETMGPRLRFGLTT